MNRRTTLLLSMILASCTTAPSSSPTTEPATTSVGVTVPSSTTTSTAAPQPSTADILETLGGEPCPESDFTCVSIEMPLDHFNPDPERTIEVTFAVLPASGESRGAFITATGGPGTSGIAVADSYTGLYDPAIAEQFDMVFFDQRGIGASGHLNCPIAAVDYYRASGDVASAGGLSSLVDAAETFAVACVSEMGDPEELAYVSTAQAVEDLEVFREEFGFEELVLFGESYGTQLSQTYAATHGEHLDRLIIDGVVDLTLDGLSYHQEMAAASSRTLDLMLEACDQDEACIGDMGAEAGVGYDRLSSQLLEGPLTVEFPLPSGDTESRAFSLSDLEVVASGHLYEEYDRMLFLRALAQYSSQGDLVPLLRLLYVNLVLDPQEQTVIEDPTWSDAMYYGVECLDYSYPGTTPEEKVAAYTASGTDVADLRLGSVYYGDLPCAFWPHTTTEDRPPPLTAEGISVLVLGSTVDPVTPYPQGVDVFGRLDNGHLMSKEGGPHIIFGWGEPCPDEEVTAFIIDGTPPTTETCEGEVIGAYQPLFPTNALEDAEVLLDSIEWELSYLPEYYYWDGFTDTSVGCDEGGTLTFTATDVGNDFEFSDCGLVEGLTMSGSGSYDSESDIFALDFTNSDCSYVYERSGEEFAHESDC